MVTKCRLHFTKPRSAHYSDWFFTRASLLGSHLTRPNINISFDTHPIPLNQNSGRPRTVLSKSVSHKQSRAATNQHTNRETNYIYTRAIIALMRNPMLIFLALLWACIAAKETTHLRGRKLMKIMKEMCFDLNKYGEQK